MTHKETLENNIEAERTKIKTWIQFRKQLLAIGNEQLKKHGLGNQSVSFNDNAISMNTVNDSANYFNIDNSEIRKGLSRCKTIIELAIKACNSNIKGFQDASKKAPNK
ncbi:MAG TPA: hypothetical protein VK528_06825 [Flavobacterium sp.]|nr:hypothetical protein [Flavobacterium sp.]